MPQTTLLLKNVLSDILCQFGPCLWVLFLLKNKHRQMKTQNTTQLTASNNFLPWKRTWNECFFYNKFILYMCQRVRLLHEQCGSLTFAFQILELKRGWNLDAHSRRGRLYFWGFLKDCATDWEFSQQVSIKESKTIQSGTISSSVSELIVCSIAIDQPYCFFYYYQAFFKLFQTKL